VQVQDEDAFGFCNSEEDEEHVSPQNQKKESQEIGDDDYGSEADQFEEREQPEIDDMDAEEENLQQAIQQRVTRKNNKVL
jgi:hypothetical protein